MLRFSCVKTNEFWIYTTISQNHFLTLYTIKFYTSKQFYLYPQNLFITILNGKRSSNNNISLRIIIKPTLESVNHFIGPFEALRFSTTQFADVPTFTSEEPLLGLNAVSRNDPVLVVLHVNGLTDLLVTKERQLEVLSLLDTVTFMLER